MLCVVVYYNAFQWIVFICEYVDAEYPPPSDHCCGYQTVPYVANEDVPVSCGSSCR